MVFILIGATIQLINLVHGTLFKFGKKKKSEFDNLSKVIKDVI